MRRLMFLTGALLLSIGLCAAAEPDYEDSVGSWSITGFVSEGGHSTACKMQTQSAEAREFAYLATIAANSTEGLTVKAAFITSTALPDGSTPTVLLTYDNGRPERFEGIVSGGYLAVDLSAMDLLRMSQELDHLQTSKRLIVIALLKGAPAETNAVDLTNSKEAFDRNGMCMKAMINKGTEQMAAAQNPAPSAPTDLDPVTEIAQKEIDRIDSIDPRLLVLRPVAVACVTFEELRDWITESIAKGGDSADVDGCYPIQKAVKVRVLDFPSVLAVHVKFILPAGASSLVQGMELYTLPAQVVDRNTVPKSLLFDALPSRHTR
ncbi:MAG TPA: hypothetical protein VIZ17_21780 [Acetobacteraceae bacterium]